MFSGNQKISGRQLERNYTAGLVSLTALWVPLLMNRENTGAVVIALVLLGLYLLGTSRIAPPQAAPVKILCYLHYWIIGTMTARMTGLLVQEFLLEGVSLWGILPWFYLFCFYNLYKGLECRLRVSEILFPFFLLLLFLLSLMMLGEVELSRCRELSFSLGKNQWFRGYALFCWLAAVQSLWHLKGSVKEKDCFGRAVGRIWLAGSAAALLWSIFTYCIYGNAGHTGLVFPLASAMTLAHFPGNVIGRMDTMFVFAWVTGLFLLCSSLFSPLKAAEPSRRGKYLLLASLAASLAAAVQPGFMELGMKILYWVSTPLQLLLLAAYGFRRGGHKVRAACLFLLLSVSLTGCGVQELEEQSIVTSIGADPGQEKRYHVTLGFGTAREEGGEPFEAEADGLEEIEALYWEERQKNLNFNHLKTFYFSAELMKQERFLELLEEIQIDGSYSRGTSVYAALGPASEEAKKEEQPEGGEPVHRLLNAWYNQESCRVLTVTEEGLYKGSISWPY